jgi:hypothetical protein
MKTGVRIVALLVLLWLIIGAIGAIGAGQRDYSAAGTRTAPRSGPITATILAGPLNYFGG